MSFPSGNVLVDENVDPNTLYLVGIRYNKVTIGIGESPRFNDEIDWESTGRSSFVMRQIGVGA
jgi:hypothetical protein